jgi:hypothetical protein
VSIADYKKHIQNMLYWRLFHCNNGCTDAPQCTLPVLFHQN